MMTSRKRIISFILSFIMLFGMLPVGSVVAAADTGEYDENFAMVLSDSSHGSNRYLTTVDSNAFNVIMYTNTFSGVFGDQHMSGIELLLHGYRIATNGDIHYLPTPEQWDATPAPSRGSRTFDDETNTATVAMTFNGAPDGTLRYNIVATPEPGGVELSVVLTSDLPESLAGKARFNLEFIPSRYENKSFHVDSNNDGGYDTFGIFPLHPQSSMEEVERPDLPSQAWYVKEWNEDRGESQPVPFAKGYKFSFAPEDELYNISISSETGELELFDGRDRAQNGWYVLSNLITGGKSGDVVAKWHIRPRVKKNWVREPNIAFSQVGYAPFQEKFAVIELDKYDNDYPTTASLLHVNADGSKDVVYSAAVTEPISWQRYKYVNFDFTEINETGMYVIQYGDQETEIFPIANDVYDVSWQSALTGFLAVQMDHIEVREGNRVWHGASHMDDCSYGPLNTSWFDGQRGGSSMPPKLAEKGIQPEEYFPGLNVGGWFDAGDFDLQGPRELEVLRDLINAACAFDNMGGHDSLSVVWDDKTGGLVEMHKPDGIPDIVQQVAHGIKYVLAQYDVLGGYGGTMELRRLRQYTHLGDPSSDTDGYIYDPNLEEGEIVERDGLVYSGVPDDRVLLGNISTNLTGDVSANIAGAAYLLYDYYPELAEKCLNTALEIWDKERAGQSASFSTEWNTLVYLVLATNKMGNERFNEFKERITPLVPRAFEKGTDWWGNPTFNISSRYNVMYIKDLLDVDYNDDIRNAIIEYAQTINYGPEAGTPFGVQWTTGSGWGAVDRIIGFGQSLAPMYKFYPDIPELKTYILRTTNYVLGRHPVSNHSWISGVGTKSHLHPYNSNRADESYIPGSILPGHITFSPDIVESLDDFNFLWFENEAIINYPSKWIGVGYAASLIANEEAATEQAPTKDFNNNFIMSVKKTGLEDGYLQTRGFELYMYNNTYDAELGDKKNAGIELIQSGRRIATNGDITLLPAPEQWDYMVPPVLNSRTIDEETNTLSANLTIPADSKGNPAVNYTLKAEPEPGGVKLTVKLDNPLPADLAGKAGFSLQFIPSQFISKSFQADSDGDGKYDSFGVFPLHAQDDMESIERVRTEDQPWYVKDWYNDEGNKQPLPLATGNKMTLAAEDDENRIRITSDSGDLMLYDGRNNTQDGWFIVRTLIPEGATEIVWHISPDVNEYWTRKPNVAYNQAGYAPDFSKVALIELDPFYDAPITAYIDRLNADGTYTEVFSGPVSDSIPWARYEYRKFDFSAVTDPGMYVIRYAGERTDPFPIAKNVYERTWQASLSGFLAIHMDHMKIREGYRIWHDHTFADDALQAPLNTEFFDGWSMGPATDSPFDAYEYIPGLATGGWYDPSDYDLDTAVNIEAIQDLALAFDEFGIEYDTLMVDNAARFVELHRVDGLNDLQQQVKQGILQILAQIENVGYVFKGLKVPTANQYIQSGDPSKVTDGLRYDSSLDENDTYGLRSGKKDDRLAFAGIIDEALQFEAAAALASASYVLKGFDDDLAVRCLEAAEDIWEKFDPLGSQPMVVDDGLRAAEWKAAIELLIATNGSKDECKQLLNISSIQQLSPERYGMSGWKAVRVLKYMDEEFLDKFMTALEEYIPVLEDKISANPFGVPVEEGNTGVLNMAISMGILNKYFPNIVSEQYTLNAVNYILGTHMYNNTSWVSGVGYKSAELGYGQNRADNFFIAGGVVGGYANVLPDFPEALDDFAFLRDQTGYGIDTSVKWIVVGSAADAIVNRELTVPTEQAVLDAADNVAPASEFTINIALDNVTAVFAEDINLEYDSNIFEYVSAEPANSDIQIVKEDASVAGKVRIIAANTGGGISGESTEILKVTFKVKEEIQSATGSISITKADLGTAPDGAVIEAQLSSKTITIGTVVEPDKTELIAAIDYAENIYDSAVVGSQPGQYPQAAKDAFRVAIDAAIAVRDDDNATQEQIDSALADLNAAIQTFKDARIPSDEVSKTALAEAISLAENLFEEAVVGTEIGQYPQEAKDAFGIAIDEAKSVYNNPNATQGQVDNALRALNIAIDTFKASVNKEVTADINNDGVIDVGDLAIVAYYYGKNSESADWNEAKIADMNGDNIIDIADLAFVATNIEE
ncbi:MAG: glycoside hydrolase family 9 protein [Bacteroidota bacterium]|nr:glycoside hydrolase family 9 protein [Bacteroidota bacterium]